MLSVFQVQPDQSDAARERPHSRFLERFLRFRICLVRTVVCGIINCIEAVTSFYASFVLVVHPFWVPFPCKWIYGRHPPGSWFWVLRGTGGRGYRTVPLPPYPCVPGHSRAYAPIGVHTFYFIFILWRRLGFLMINMWVREISFVKCLPL